MIIVDTNVWIDHFRSADAHLIELLKADKAAIHPYTIAEIGLGSLSNRSKIIEQLEMFWPAPVAAHQEVMAMIDLNKLAGTGVGYVDCHLLTAALLAGGQVWTRDKRLEMQAGKLGIRHDPITN